MGSTALRREPDQSARAREVSESPYELWVTALRRWADDSSATLAGLPTLTEESLPPVAYQRLLRHIRETVDTVGRAAADQLSRDLAAACDAHEIEKAMVAVRPALLRRLELARHPGLPQQFRDAFEKSAVEDISRLQQDVEKAMSTSSNRYGSDRTERERSLRAVRETSLLAVLKHGYQTPLPTAPPVSAPQPGAVRSSSGRVRRRIYQG